jgi:30S ribosomal protein S31
MGKGDLRTRRGKIHRGTYGNTRPKKSKKRKMSQAQAQAQPPSPPPAPPKRG